MQMIQQSSSSSSSSSILCCHHHRSRRVCPSMFLPTLAAAMMAVVLVVLTAVSPAAAFQPILSPIIVAGRGGPLSTTTADTNDAKLLLMSIPAAAAATTTTSDTTSSSRRRSILISATSSILLPLATGIPSAYATEESMYAPKFVQTYEDFITMPEGWSYKDVKSGSGTNDWKDGDRVVFDWSGYTIGYFGRPFEAKGGPQGGAFDKDINYFRTILGSHTLIPGVESALRTMKVGGIRQVIVPYGPLSYPSNSDLEHDVVGPKPTTFSGMRALNFVLENERVDRTLLFNVKLVRVDRSDGRGGFTRGGSGDSP